MTPPPETSNADSRRSALRLAELVLLGLAMLMLPGRRRASPENGDGEEKVVVNAGTDFERTDMNLRHIGWLALAALLLVLGGPAVVVAVYQRAVGDVSRAVPPLAEPKQQLNPPADRAAFTAEQWARLNSYGWVDRDKGIVHIPIAAAMQRIARQGIPDFKQGAAP